MYCKSCHPRPHAPRTLRHQFPRGNHGTFHLNQFQTSKPPQAHFPKTGSAFTFSPWNFSDPVFSSSHRCSPHPPHRCTQNEVASSLNCQSPCKLTHTLTPSTGNREQRTLWLLLYHRVLLVLQGENMLHFVNAKSSHHTQICSQNSSLELP